MLVKLERNFNDEDGNFHQVRDGIAELRDDYLTVDNNGEAVKGEEAQQRRLPKGAVIVSKNGTIPSPAVPVRPGFQGKSLNNQVADLVQAVDDKGVIAAAVVESLAGDDNKLTEESVANAEEAAKNAAASAPKIEPKTASGKSVEQEAKTSGINPAASQPAPTTTPKP